MIRPRLNDCFPDWINGKGVMSEISESFPVPWKADMENDFVPLDIAYHGQHSGMKLISQFAYPWIPDIDANNFVISDADKFKICAAIYHVNKRKWQKLWDMYNTDYDPLTNYDMHTVTDFDGSRIDTNIKTFDDSVNKTGTDTITDTYNSNLNSKQNYDSNIATKKTGNDISSTEYGSQVVTAYDTEEIGIHDIYGFNSNIAVNADLNTTTKTGTETETKSGIDETTTTYNSNINEEHTGIDTRDDKKTGTDTEEKQYNSGSKHTGTIDEDNTRKTDDLTTEDKKGNIGVATIQRMYREEIENWKWKFFNEVFSDIDDMLCLKIY